MILGDGAFVHSVFDHSRQTWSLDEATASQYALAWEPNRAMRAHDVRVVVSSSQQSGDALLFFDTWRKRDDSTHYVGLVWRSMGHIDELIDIGIAMLTVSPGRTMKPSGLIGWRIANDEDVVAGFERPKFLQKDLRRRLAWMQSITTFSLKCEEVQLVSDRLSDKTRQSTLVWAAEAYQLDLTKLAELVLSTGTQQYGSVFTASQLKIVISSVLGVIAPASASGGKGSIKYPAGR